MYIWGLLFVYLLGFYVRAKGEGGIRRGGGRWEEEGIARGGRGVFHALCISGAVE